MAEDTIFGKIIRGEIPCDKVYEDDDYFAFKDINPAAPVHVLIVPKKPIPMLTDATQADAALLGGLLLAANRVAEIMGIAENGFRCVVNCGAGGGQLVFHLHLHLLGGRDLCWPPG
jgi:histidine triad (HIT) family protein